MRFPSCLRCLLLALTLLSPSQSLRQAADSAGVLIGAAVRPSLLSEPAYASTLAREFNLVEPEDALKWWVIRRNSDGFDFQGADEIVRFAQAHGMKIRGHCLVWDHDHPGWLANGHFAPSQLSQLLHEHIDRVMKRYAGQVFAWDVVNEAMDENGRLRDSLWYNRPGIGFADQGTAYLEQAFRWAHEADPHALLFYNEAEGEMLNRKSDAIYEMLKGFKRRGVPIDGVGLQLHIPNLEIDEAALAANIARLTALGLQVHITELDVSLTASAAGDSRVRPPHDHDLRSDDLRNNDLLRQAQVYRSVVRACLQNPGCTAIQTWGFSDKYSWIGSHSHGTRGRALLFDKTYQPKPAYDAVLQELSAARTTRK
ncbi:MAG TPA: endo-1,4-beta-xylanase [Candidatus Sulfotelmatobacter sp.]|nr:endo-1,4-beta-xylanase [Candidatus Sulfotelmatobacter sp.]